MKICVLGDVMLDIYRTITPTKLSQEAPVVVGRFEHNHYTPGGAANAAANCAVLGAEAILIGYIGKDDTGSILTQVLTNFGIVNKCVIPSNWDTISKERVVDSTGHQFIRVDMETPDPLTKKSCTAALRRRLRAAEYESDCLFISDYDKGTCQWVTEYAIKLFKKHGKFIVVNGKPQNLLRYLNANVITMNRAEWFEAHKLYCSGDIEYDEQILHQIRVLLNGGHVDPIGNSTLVMTRGEEKLLVLRPKDHVTDYYSARQVVAVADVSGAGDTLAAVIAVMGDNGPETFHEAMQIAAEVVQQRGTAVPRRRDLC
jgi:D-beta-D-heptose 7-phosphate kinase/D-beta-D-heptose 1-phosphate adenosyltransferase